jgi:CheY-like chemotaxis protein
MLSRLRAMGLRAELVSGERSVVAELPLRPAPFPSTSGPVFHRRVRFATVGPAHVKCLEPRALFHLPLVPIGGCEDAGSIEDRIRGAWAAHGEAVREAGRRLARLGARPAADADGALLALPLGVEDEGARAYAWQPGCLSLPSRGPLSGLPLPHAAERLFAPPAGLDSATDLDIALTNRLEALARERRREEERRRTERAHRAPVEALAPRPVPARVRPRILLVGPKLGRNDALVHALRRCGFAATPVRGASAAVDAFQSASFDLVLADADLGRFEGLELIPTLEALPGVAHLPVVLVDDRPRPARKEAARRVGAAGYLVHPIEAERVAAGLDRMAGGSRGRRYDRFPSRLAVRFADGEGAGFTTAVSRLGMFVRTEREAASAAVERCDLALPELGRAIGIEAQILYRVEASATRPSGLGLRFRAFPDGDEAAWIGYLRALADAEGS